MTFFVMYANCKKFNAKQQKLHCRKMQIGNFNYVCEKFITMEITVIQNKIFEIRGQRVMLDFHLAELYLIETRVLKQSVRRNIERFPDDFLFQLTEKEANILISMGTSQFVIPPGYNPGSSKMFAFTELGVAMLSSVLRSPIAIEINIRIMRAFVELRKMIVGYDELSKKIEQLELETNMQFHELYQVLTEMSGINNQKQNRPNPVGYITYPDKK
jgi:hypothetical protein